MPPLDTLTAPQILAIPAAEPERLFSGDPDNLRREFAVLAKCWHPDHNGSSAAADVLARVVTLYEAARRKLAAREWCESGLLRLDTVAGRQLVLEVKRRRPCELGEMAIAADRIVFLVVVDPINRPNPWQGALRFAPLDLDLLRATIADDLSDAAAAGIKVDAGVGVTCVDQVRQSAEVITSGIRTAIPKSRLAREIAAAAGLPLLLEAHGPWLSAVDLVSGAAEATHARPGPHPAERAVISA